MKVRMTWYELVEREEILEVDSIEEAYDTEISLGNGDEVEVNLMNQIDSSYSIGHEVISDKDIEKARFNVTIKLTNDNLEKVVDYIESQLADEDAGEFDEETSILSAVERTIEMFEENEDE